MWKNHGHNLMRFFPDTQTVLEHFSFPQHLHSDKGSRSRVHEQASVLGWAIECFSLDMFVIDKRSLYILFDNKVTHTVTRQSCP